MEAATELFNKISSSKDDMNVAKLAEIVSFNTDTMTVDVQPLPSKDYDIVLNVPYMVNESKDFFFYIPPQENDLVLLIYIDNDIDNFLMGSDSLSTDRKHNETDCICIGGVSRINAAAKVKDSDALTIATKDNRAAIEIKNNGDINITGRNVVINGDRIDFNEF